MTITTTHEDKALVLALEGRLDTTTAPQLETVLKAEMADITALTLDFEKLEYISSAGLRVLLAAQKSMKNKGTMEVCNVNEAIMEVFDITGFTDILTIR